MRVLFLGFSVSASMFARVLSSDRGMPVQTQRFGWAFISCFQRAGIPVDLISAEPVRDFPHNSRLLIRGRRFEENGTEGESTTFVNLPGFKHVMRYVSARRVARGLDLGSTGAVVVHGVNSAFLWLAVSIGAKRSIPVIAVLTDAPSLATRYDNGLTSWMKRYDHRLILGALRKVDGVVTLTPQLAASIAPGKPSMLMEGIAVAVTHGAKNAIPRDVPKVVYAGGLLPEYGVVDLIDSMGKARETWSVEVYGRGPAEEAVVAASQHSRITYGGSVGPEGMADVYASSDILVNPRPAGQLLATESFPSKLLEYMATGIPVVTTDLPTLPDDYRAHLTVAESGPDGLAQAIDRLVALGPGNRSQMGERARHFILESRGVERQGARLLRFISDLAVTKRVRS